MPRSGPDTAGGASAGRSPLAACLALGWRLCAALPPDAASALGGAPRPAVVVAPTAITGEVGLLPMVSAVVRV